MDDSIGEAWALLPAAYTRIGFGSMDQRSQSKINTTYILSMYSIANPFDFRRFLRYVGSVMSSHVG